MGFIYNGDHDNMTAFGLVFRVDGVNREVDTKDKGILAKLRGNPHFDEMGGTETDLTKLTRAELQDYARETFNVDIPMASKAAMLETVEDLESNANAD